MSKSKKSKSSRQWLNRQHADEYTQRAKVEGYRSRAAYKLLELHERYTLFKPGMRVVDLGAAPGSWLQIARKYVGPTGFVVGLDILPIEPIEGVTCLQGDFSEDRALEQLLNELCNQPIDIVICDMAPNLSGISAIDMPRAVYLSELALDFVSKALKPKGALVIKLFQGEGFDDINKQIKAMFDTVIARKPKASRQASREVYLLAKGYNKEEE